MRVRLREVSLYVDVDGCGPTDGYEPEIPVLILVGADDPVVPTAAAQRLAASLQRARAVVLAQAGHGVFRHAPDRALPAVRDFLEAVRRDPR
jgi:pimeloyl-ACP methyl ester carboxylesterase